MRFAYLALSFGFAAGFSATASAQFALHDGDRVAFYGDSITDNGTYTRMIETFVLTRFPKMNVRFINAGVSGDKVTGGGMGPIDERLPRDLFSRKPTVVTVMLGMNDGLYQSFDPGVEANYEKGLRHIADRLKSDLPSSRVWLLEPSPYDEVTQPVKIMGGYNNVLRGFGDFVAKLARERGYGVVDLNKPLTDALAKAKEAEPEIATRIIPDRIHPSLPGHLIMAATILKAWGAPPIVSRTEIDAANGHANGLGADIRDVKVQGSVRWSSIEESLPFPLDRRDPATALVVRTTPVEEWLGREIVVIKNLAPGNYTLKIDGGDVITFPAETFSSGVDLSWLETPMLKQAWRVDDLTKRRSALEYSKWRTVEYGLRNFDSKARQEAIKSMDKLEDDLVKRQHDEAKPVPHTFELVRIS